MKARELLSDPFKWTQDVFAKDKDSAEVDTDSKEAVRFCLLGATKKCYQASEWPCIWEKIEDEIGTDDIADWNDDPERTYEDVKHVLDKLDI